MSINSVVIGALSPLRIPVAFQSYSGQAERYITFFSYLEQPEQHADDDESMLGQYVQLDLWSKDDYTETVGHVHQQMVEAGFRRKSFADLYEEDLGIYHKVMRYVWERTVNEKGEV